MTAARPQANRLKLSPPMAGIAFRQVPSARGLKERLCRVFAENGLNMTFLATVASTGMEDLFCCLDEADGPRAAQLIDLAAPPPFPPCRVLPSVSLLSVFPHQSDIHLVGRLLHRLWTARLRVHAAASSIAAVTVVVDTDQRQLAMATVASSLGGPPQDRSAEP